MKLEHSLQAATYMKSLLLLLLFTLSTISHALPKADMVVVNKSNKKLYLIKQGKSYRQYDIALGPQPTGHKIKSGDERTPEGHYVLDYKHENSDFYRAIHISYPNNMDIEKARSKGVDPGGSIMIHGMPNNLGWPESLVQSFNWTNGCIAVTNSEMDEIWSAIDEGTPIEIQP